MSYSAEFLRRGSAATCSNGDTGAVGSTRHVTVYTRDGCHLCDNACATVQRVSAELAVTWSAVNIDSDAQLRARYSEEVPVILVDGAQIAYWRIDEDKLRTALSAGE